MFVALLTGFSWFALCIQFSACLTWTKYPESVTRVWNGSRVALKWDYNLTTEEQNAANTFISRIWERGNESHLESVALKNSLSGQSTTYAEDFKPHVTVSRSEKATLIINVVTKEDEAVYKFTVRFLTLGDRRISRNFSLEVGVQPIVLCPKTEQVKQGERGLIFCNVTGDPKPNITWTKETHPGKVISYNSTLVIDNASIFDEGKYNITANNGRSASVLVELEVIFPPSVEISNKTATAVEGDRLNFTCAASGKPEPKITWTKVGSAEVIAHTPSVSVIVERLGTRDSINQYRCTASNGVGIPATATVNVTVHFAPKMTNLTIYSNPKNTTVLLNSNLTLLCVTTANPPALYHLYFIKSYIGNSSSGEFDITVEGDGVYICVPVNTVGTGNNVTLSIIAVVSPSVEISDKTATAVEGDKLNFTCTTSGKPEPKIAWTKVGSAEVIAHTPSISVIVDRPETQDNINQYQCTTSNGVGVPATATVNVTVYSNPLV